MLVPVTAPAGEPLQLEEVKLHLGYTTDDQDSLIEDLIVQARQYVENHTHRALMTQTWDLKLDRFPSWRLEIPKPPFQSVASVSYVDQNGLTQTLAGTTNYVAYGGFDPVTASADPHVMPGYLEPAYATYWPQTRDVPQAVTVRFSAGYGAYPSKVPGMLKGAMKVLILTWFSEARRGFIVDAGATLSRLPLSDESLLWPFKVAPCAA